MTLGLEDCTCTLTGVCAVCRPRNDRRPVMVGDLELPEWNLPCLIRMSPSAIKMATEVLRDAGVQFDDARTTLHRILDALCVELWEVS